MSEPVTSCVRYGWSVSGSSLVPAVTRAARLRLAFGGGRRVGGNGAAVLRQTPQRVRAAR